jgi:hypothetical protein
MRIHITVEEVVMDGINFLIQYSNEKQPGYFATYMGIHLRTLMYVLLRLKLTYK